MSKFITKITNLIEVKKIIALIVVSVFCNLAYSDKVDTNVFASVVTLIVGYYFGQSTANNSNIKKEDDLNV